MVIVAWLLQRHPKRQMRASTSGSSLGAGSGEAIGSRLTLAASVNSRERGTSRLEASATSSRCERLVEWQGDQERDNSLPQPRPRKARGLQKEEARSERGLPIPTGSLESWTLDSSGECITEKHTKAEPQKEECNGTELRQHPARLSGDGEGPH
jgi:hypothetical protein